MKLFYYSNMHGVASWARNPEDFRKNERLNAQAIVVRAAHKGIAPPPGYFKPDGELANDSIAAVPPPQFKPGRRYQSTSLADLGGTTEPKVMDGFGPLPGNFPM